jgi:hypothetical protein
MWFLANPPNQNKPPQSAAFSSHQLCASRYFRPWIAMKIAHTTTEVLIRITNGLSGDFVDFAIAAPTVAMRVAHPFVSQE